MNLIIMKTNKISNNILQFLLFPFLFLALSSCGSIYEFPEEKSIIASNWEMIWEDDFNKNEIDATYWSKTERGKSPWSRYMTDNENCYELRDGVLILKGLLNDFLPNDTATYLTGGISTKNKKCITFGKIDVKAKIKETQGAWPAIWTNTNNWPTGGEIDIMESINHDNAIYQTVHSEYTLIHGMTTNPNHITINSVYDKSEFNVYSVIIDENEIIFSINNIVTLIYPKINTTIEGQYPFGDKKYLLLTMQLFHETWTGPVNNSELPAEIHIDWVRFYDKIDINRPNY